MIVRAGDSGTEPCTFLQTDAASEGFGLIGMRERIALVDGELSFHSRPGTGKTVNRPDPCQAAPARTCDSNTGSPPHRCSA